MSVKRLTLLIAGNRLGKSEVAMRETLFRARGDHPYKKVRLANQIWVGVPGFKFLRETTVPHFDKWCPPAWLLDPINESDWFVKIRRVDGGICVIRFKTFDQGRGVWQGAGVDFIHLDEECPEDIYKEARARLVDRRGAMLITQTPVEGMGWLYDRLYLPGLAERRDRIEVIQGALAEYDEDAPGNIGKVLVPHLSYQDVLDFSEDYPDPDEKAIRVFGQFRKRAGLIYKAFDTHTHVIAPFEIPDYWPIWGAVDPGYHGFAMTLWTMAPNGRMYVIGELFSQAEPTKVRLSKIAEVFWSRRARNEDDNSDDPEREVTEAETCVMFVDTEDPQTVLELNLAANEQRVPIVFVSLDQGLKAVKAGILKWQQLLEPAMNRETPREVKRSTGKPPKGEPMVYIFDDLYSEWRGADDKMHTGSRLLWEIMRYTWAKPARGKTVQKDEPDKESAHGAHTLDTGRYAIMARMGAPEAPKKDQRQHLSQIEREVWEDMEHMDEQMSGGLP